jgi:hypothetical protein
MRRIKLATGAVVAALLLATVPMSTAQAAQPSPSTYTVFITICDGVEAPVREAGPIRHEPGSWHTGNEFVLMGSEWVRSGTLRIDFRKSNWGVSNPSGVGSGTFEVRDDLLGDYDGHWAWNYGLYQDGHGVGQGIGASRGDHVKVDFLLNDPVGLPDPPADWCSGAPAYGYNYLVMSTY